MAKTPSKPFVFPKAKAAKVTPPPILKPEQALKQFHTTPVVLPMKQGRINKIIAPMKSPLKPPKSNPVVKAVAPADPLAPLKTYLP